MDSPDLPRDTEINVTLATVGLSHKKSLFEKLTKLSETKPNT